MGRRGARARGKKKRGGIGGKSSARDNTAKSSNRTDSTVLKTAADSALEFGIGTRVRCPHIASMGGLEDSPCTGTVVGHRSGVGSRPEGLVVRLDSGKAIFNLERYFEKSDDPPYAEFNTGSRVECKLGESGVWFPGTVLQSHGGDWAQDDRPPYFIGFDYGRVRSFWGPPNCIRRSSVPAPGKARKHLRFKVGDRVDCRCDGGISPGTVIKTWYGEDGSFENGHTVPYKIQLDSGSHIYAPVDNDACIRKSNVPAPECWICFDNEQSESNLIVRDCVCRGERNGFVHTQCLVRLAIEKTNMEDEPNTDDSPMLFGQCLTCRQLFAKGSHSDVILTKVFYHITSDYDISNTWNKMACTMMSELLVHNEDYDQAISLLQERITKIRSRMTDSMDDEDNQPWIKDLSNFLLHLADVYGSIGSFDEMKEVIDESMMMTDLLEDVPKTSKIKTGYYLARCLYGMGEHCTALQFAEEAIALAREEGGDLNKVLFSNLLSLGGELNVEINDRERGMALMSESVETMTRLYGSDHAGVRLAREKLCELREGC